MRSKFTKLFLTLPLIAAGSACGSIGSSETGYPNDEVTFVIPFAPGGSTDPIGREYAAHLEDVLGTSVAVLNREGGGGAVGTNEVLQAEPDGYTLGLCIDSSLALTPQLQDLPYSPEDAALIAGLVTQPANLAVAADSPWETLDDFVQYSKKNPGEVQLGNSGALSVTDLEVHKLADTMGTEIQSVAFAGGGEALTALLGGRIDGVVGRGPTFAGSEKAGDIKVLGTYRDEGYPFLPEATPFAEAGVDMANTPEIIGICAPAGLPDDVKETLVDASLKVAESPEFTGWLEENGYIPTTMDPEEYAETIESYRDAYGEILKANDLL